MSEKLNKVLVGDFLFHYQGIEQNIYSKLVYTINQKTGEKIFPKN